MPVPDKHNNPHTMCHSFNGRFQVNFGYRYMVPRRFLLPLILAQNLREISYTSSLLTRMTFLSLNEQHQSIQRNSNYSLQPVSPRLILSSSTTTGLMKAEVLLSNTSTATGL